MTIETEQETLHEDSAFDMETLIAEVLSQETDDGDDAQEEDEVGPSAESEGELSEDEPLSADDEDFEEDDESDEDAGTSEEDDESDEEDSPDPDEVGPEAAAKVDPKDEEIANLKALVLQTQQQSQQLIDFVLTQQEQASQKAQSQQAAKAYDLTEDQAHLFLFSGDQEAIGRLDPGTQAKGRKLAQDWTKDHARYALDPRALYQERIRDFVLADLQQMVGPIVQERTTSQAKAAIDRHMGDMSPESQQRVAEVFKELGVPTEAGLKAAVKVVRQEEASKQLAERERKVQVSERQKRANREASRKRARPGGRSRKANKQPQWDPTRESLDDFQRRLRT